jgi:diacylglycerol kinase (ATP)
VKVLLLHNPTAGGGKPSKEDLLGLLSRADCDTDYLATDDPQLERRLTDPVDLLAIAGGDGTVAKVLTHVDGDTAPVTILPLGTANNLAGALGIRGSIGDLVAGLRQSRMVALDVGMSDGPWGLQRFFESVGFGMLAGALGPVNQSRLPSPQKIPEGRQAVRRVLRDMPPTRLRARLDDRLLDEEILMLEVSKVAALGPRLRIAPGAEPGDGFLHVAYLPVERREAMLAWLDDPEEGTDAPTVVRTTRRAEVAWHDTPSHLDDFFHDEPARPARVQAWLQPGTVKVLVPGGHPR